MFPVGTKGSRFPEAFGSGGFAVSAGQLDSADRPLAQKDRRIVGHLSLFDGHPRMRAIRTIIESIADTDTTLLIRGESGVGKDLVARAVHAASSRRHGPLDVDTRVIAATNRNLEEAMARGEFREDLYYRLNVVEIQVPPLRERREEIPGLAVWFLAKFNAQYGRQKQLLPETMARLMEYTWSGNVRELENVIRRLVVLTDGEQMVEALVDRRRTAHPEPPRPMVVEGLREIARRGAREAERKALAEVLQRVHWNRAEASRILKVSYN